MSYRNAHLGHSVTENSFTTDFYMSIDYTKGYFTTTTFNGY